MIPEVTSAIVALEEAAQRVAVTGEGEDGIHKDAA